MKKYLAHIRSKSPHERRTHAAQLSAGIVAIVFVAWISTIGLRFSTIPAQSATDDVSQTATVLSATQMQNSLQVATSSSYNY